MFVLLMFFFFAVGFVCMLLFFLCVCVCVDLVAIHRIQWDEFSDEYDFRPPLRMYDGSWAEWGSQPDTPVQRPEEPSRVDAHGFKIPDN